MEYAIKNNENYESVEFNEKVIQTQGIANIKLLGKLKDNDFAIAENIHNGNKLTTINYPKNVVLKLSSPFPFTYTLPNYKPKYQNKNKVEDFLYEITYGNIDYEYAKRHFKPIIDGGCSSIRNGNFFGRNFDWKYNNQVQFIVHTPSSFYTYAVLGISGLVPGIEKDNVENDDIIIHGVDMFKLLPFYLLDGINEKKVFCSYNLTHLDNEHHPTTEVKAKIEEKERLCVLMLVRYILDNFNTAKNAIEYVKNYVTLYFPVEMINAGYQVHFMIGDNNNTYILEFINGEIKIIKNNYITNFNIYGVELNKDNTIKYPPTQYGVGKFGNGLERWNIISKNFNKCKKLDGMRDTLDLIKYSNCYNYQNFWYSEIVKMHDDNGNIITVDTNPNICNVSKNKMIEAYNRRDRNKSNVFITCHSSIYDISNLKLHLINQEEEYEYYISFLK